MESTDRLDFAYGRLNAELAEKKAARSRIDAEIGEITLRMSKLDDARIILAEMGGNLPMSAVSMSDRMDEIPIDGRNKVRDFVLSLMDEMPLNQWLPANAILNLLKQRGYEAPTSRNSAYASVYVTLGRLVDESLVASTEGSRGKVFAKAGSNPNSAVPNPASVLFPPDMAISAKLAQLPNFTLESAKGENS